MSNLFCYLNTILIMLFSGVVLAESAQKELAYPILCKTGYPTTTFVITPERDSVIVRMINHNGMEYSPSLAGNFTPHDLPLLEQKAKDAKVLLPDMKFSFEKKSCKMFGDILFSCDLSNESQKISGNEIKTYSISINRSLEENSSGIFSSFKVRLRLSVNNRQLDIETPYSDEECVKN